MVCIFCEKEAVKVFRPDPDLTGYGHCLDHEKDFEIMQTLSWTEEWEWDKVERFIERVKKRDKKKSQQ